jgi:hypothetical protein
MSMPTTSTMLALELVISDHNKSLLLANAQFIPYLWDYYIATHSRTNYRIVLSTQPHASKLMRLHMRSSSELMACC